MASLKRITKALNFDWLTALSALLIVLSFPPWNFTHLIWIALIPWFMALHKTDSHRKAFSQGVWLSFLMTLGGFYWIAYVLTQFGGVPWWGSILGLLLFALFNQIQFLVFAPFQRQIQRQLVSQNGTSLISWQAAGLAVTSGLFYAGMDWLLPKLFVDTLGHAFYNSKHLRQVADLGGATLLTFFVYLVNLAGWTLIQRLRDRREPSLWPAFIRTIPQIIIAALFCIAGLTYGTLRYDQIQKATANPKRMVQFGVIQANIGDFEKVASELGVRSAATNIIKTFIDLSDKALSLDPKPQVLVWPETAYPSTFRTPDTSDELARDQQIENYVKDRKVPLLFGGYDRSGSTDYNAFFFLAPTSHLETDLQTYRKNMLLLFGEYIPGAEYIPQFKKYFPQVANFGRGIGPDVLKVVPTPQAAPVHVGPIICYEALFPNYVIAAARKGSEMILNITNDSWFGPYGEPELHLALTAFRSIETRLPQLRSTNTGISALILPDGEITQATHIGAPEILNASVPLLSKPIPTLMMTWGDWFGPFSFAVGFGAFAYLWGISWISARKKLAITSATKNTDTV